MTDADKLVIILLYPRHRFHSNQHDKSNLVRHFEESQSNDPANLGLDQITLKIESLLIDEPPDPLFLRDTFNLRPNIDSIGKTTTANNCLTNQPEFGHNPHQRSG